ncbi:UDP-3-O-(3-hydroxymyristoyl)glucosamine N-acyltransferase [Paroceanicella profunda]|uniref:UDP-3-O-acylglucosamine N-acyltransferase n=1 Tax=Paroceanicella profunda TaxID=2579971 RepID=A0A5B8FHW0_9RHOB|nr:UDP-3-O-(3-hydroxymyristoyl)glucosamine N-acyltransferase [Paroceanicella profunda]QDL92921.1 UDP-3-O-(3-hydroxymyristoyl)glucosamine N-acyltransferase [Paroceanicella profunda]
MSMTIADLATALGAEAVGDLSLTVVRPAAPGEAGVDDLALAMEPSYEEAARDTPARAALLWPGADWEALGFSAALFAPRSRYVMAGVTRAFDQPLHLAPGIHPMTDIHPEAEIGPGASIGAFVTIGPGTRIGAGARIFPHACVAENVTIGEGALIQSGARIMRGTRIGDRFICQPNAVIGGDGFSFVTPQAGAVEEAKTTGKLTADGSRHDIYTRIQSLGAVLLGDDVEVGANACIDRGTVADTRVGDGSKIDNLVQIGHNVVIGRGCMICGNVGIAGSTRIGDRVVLGGGVGVADHVTIGSDVIVAGGSLVAGSIGPNQVMMGIPAMPREIGIQSMVLQRKLPELFRRVRELQKRVSKS